MSIEQQSFKGKTISSFIWRLLQNAGTQIINFVIQIILARLLMPREYGLIALTMVFIAIANVFIQTGFSSAIIQKKEISQLELSSVFLCGVILATVLYGALFVTSPYIAKYYGELLLTSILRIQALTIIIASFYSVHQAILTRNLLFKKSFVVSLIAAIIQGAIGISMAILGKGVWSLVIANIANSIVYCVGMFIVIKWRPNLLFKWKSVKIIFSFSSKIMVSNLLNTGYNNVKSLIIGKVYNNETLGYFNRGFQFPNIIMANIDGAMTTVLFSALSKFQDNWDEGLKILRRSMKLSMFICTPLMIGLIAIAHPMVIVLLTEKWIKSVPFIQISALICITWPLSARIHALNAIGRSDITVKINIVTILFALALMFVTIQFGVYAFALSTLFASLISVVIVFIICSKLLNYKIIDQLKDILPSLVLSSVMGISIYFIQFIGLNSFLTLIFQIFFGVLIYISFAWVFKIDSLIYLINLINNYFIHPVKR